ncbi:MAG TPA: hypothetical protein PLQ20_02095 [Candidatus Paceibacterota bacterium]|nr:hypothetical protein [Candidatus Paceibacterota bacterium]
MKLELGPKVHMFRTMYDPMIGPIPKQAFVPSTSNMEAWLTHYGVYVKVLHTNFEHLVPFANIQSIRLEGGEITTIQEEPMTQSVKVDKRTKEYKERIEV